MTTKYPENLNYLLQQEGPLSSKEIQTRLSVSQATVSRMFDQLGDPLIRVGRARSTLYALARKITGEGYRVPLFQINKSGAVIKVAALSFLVNGGSVIEQAGKSPLPYWLAGVSNNGYFEGLPYFLIDLKPEGFLGREIARALSGMGSYPSDLRNWSDEDILNYLLLDAADLTGNFLLGSRAKNRYMQIKYSCVQKKSIEYPKLAEKAVSGETPGSSAGGEQPKFLTYTKNGHVIVKFSPAGSGQEAIRWRDLLICEHLALELLRDSNQSAVTSNLVEYKGRVFLEGLRFDRQDDRGRIASISLRIIDTEFVGSLENWIVTAEKLFELGCLSKSSVEKIRIAHFFGQWIQNTDMHFGNLSLTLGENQFEVLPIYDMLPMRFSPVRGEILNQSFKVPENTARSHGAWLESGELACQYWELISTDKRLSKPFQAMAKTFIPLCRAALKNGQ